MGPIEIFGLLANTLSYLRIMGVELQVSRLLRYQSAWAGTK